MLLTYERLIAESRLATLPAAGTFVARRRLARPRSHRTPRTTTSMHRGRTPVLSARRPPRFPTTRWRALMRGALDRLGEQQADHPSGNAALRAAIAGWLSVSRGIAVAPEQIIVVNSRRHAVHITAHMLLVRGSRAVIEDPTDPGVAAALASAGATLLRVPTDAKGLCTTLLPEATAALVHVSPEHHRMLGVRLSLERRRAVLAWATQAGAMAIEGDCEGDLRAGIAALPSPMSLGDADNVILVGGFSTSLGSWLTLGYMVVPSRLVRAAPSRSAAWSMKASTGWKKPHSPTSSAVAPTPATSTAWARQMPSGERR